MEDDCNSDSESAPPQRVYDQNLLDTTESRITVSFYQEQDLTEDVLQRFYDDLPAPRAVGLGWATTIHGSLTVLVISAKDKAILIKFTKKATGVESVLAARNVLQSLFLCNSQITPHAFDMGRLALSLYRDRDLRIANAVNVQDACKTDAAYKIVNAVSFAVNGTNIKPYLANIKLVFANITWDSTAPASVRSVVFRAWLAAYMPYIGDMEERFHEVKRVNTQNKPEVRLLTLAQLDRSDQRLDNRKASTKTNEFTSIRVNTRFPHKVRVKLDRFQTRLLPKSFVRVLVRDQYSHEYVVHGRTHDVAPGQFAEISAQPSFTFEDKLILDITTISPEDHTQAELKRDAHILRVLQDQHTLTDSPFLHLIWPDDNPTEWPVYFQVNDHVPPLCMNPSQPMNNSQQTAVFHMLKVDNDHRITIIQGPPGTGKTTVIATFVLTATAAGASGIWLVAQSNVAVKNIAEKLDSSGFSDWKLLVSKDFHQDWHEHLYRKISSKIIRSDEFKLKPKDLDGVKVILCTLSMLSHFKINIFTSQIPIRTLVVDEASQIKVSDYISPVSANPTLRKICFIGDDKQLPPFGQDEIEDIKSIFEISHLRLSAVFLDIQYRMPPQIGDFISDAVYEGQLRSNPHHLQAHANTCFFVDVISGQEEMHDTSYQNKREAVTIIKMVEHLQKEDPPSSFRIITPYDAQRSLLEDDLKAANLPYANKCFNVDSFQGNEDDTIILSLVRSHELGFLQDLRRTNVMLTRCKHTLFVCSSRNFLLSGPGSDSLVGRMAAAFGEEAWIDLEDIEIGNF